MPGSNSAVDLAGFGNPALGTQFITANAAAGLDWPMRLLVYENEKGEVWLAYTDFRWIARRHGISTATISSEMADERDCVNYVERDVKT